MKGTYFSKYVNQHEEIFFGFRVYKNVQLSRALTH
jgi:hypothetical protein